MILDDQISKPMSRQFQTIIRKITETEEEIETDKIETPIEKEHVNPNDPPET